MIQLLARLSVLVSVPVVKMFAGKGNVSMNIPAEGNSQLVLLSPSDVELSDIGDPREFLALAETQGYKLVVATENHHDRTNYLYFGTFNRVLVPLHDLVHPNGSYLFMVP